MRYILCLLFLCLPSLAFGQVFESVIDSSKYPRVENDLVVPRSKDEAILIWSYTPANSLAGVPFNVVSARIVSSFKPYESSYALGTFGYTKADTSTDVRTWATIISADKIYSYNNVYLASVFLNGIQSFLVSQNLGTVQQRAAYIAGFKAKPPQIVSPGDILGTFTKMLGPWAYALVGMWIALIGLDLGTRNMKKVAGEAAKLERSARRTEINRQIKNDQTARVYQRKLRNMSHFLYTYPDRDDFYKDVRKRFKQTSVDYAEYKASKGWIL